MRILQVHTRYREKGGEDSVVRDECELLREAGHEVLLHTLSNPVSALAATKALIRAPWNGAAARDVVRVATEFRADVVHVHNTWFALSPAVFGALRKAGFPVVATIHNYRLSCVNAMHYREGAVCDDCLGRVPWRGVVHRCYRDSTIESGVVTLTIGAHRLAGTWEDDVDVILALTPFAADRLIASGVSADRIVVKPNVVFDPGPRSLPASSSKRLLFVGRLTEEKGVPDLLEAWKETRTDLDLEIVGDGPLLPLVEAARAGEVSVTGALSRDEIRTRMLAARALVLPSRWFEGLPMVLVEALSCGLPVIVPDHGALPEVAGDAGLVFTPSDPTDLARAITTLEEDDLVESKSSAARRAYEEHHSPAVGLVQLTNAYQRAFANRVVPVESRT